MIKETQNFSFKVRNIEIWNNPNYTFHLNFVGEKLFIILSVSVLSVSVSADMKIIISVFYRYRPIWKKAYRSYTGSTGKYLRRITAILPLSTANKQLPLYVWVSYATLGSLHTKRHNLQLVKLETCCYLQHINYSM